MKRWATAVLPQRLKEAVIGESLEKAEEIRIRVNRPIVIHGRETKVLSCIPTVDECQCMLELVCNHSVFAYEAELEECFVTLEDGSRVGICGKVNHGGIILPHSFNIRLAREVRGAADEFLNIIKSGSALLLSVPGAGKTTVLRDAARQLSENGIKVCIADERNEIAASVSGIPTLDVGCNTDVMCGCKKAKAMELMIRSMSPDILMTDEIATEEDARAVLNAAGCGVKVIASAHGSSIKTLCRRGHVANLVLQGIFDKVVLLENYGGRRSFRDITEEEL